MVQEKTNRIIRVRLDDVYPLVISGQGMMLRGPGGKEYLDGLSGSMNIIIGYGVTEVAEAVAQQTLKLNHVSPIFFTSEPAEELADILLEMAPSGFSYVHFANSGSEAVEAMFQLARQYQVSIGQPRRYKIISVDYDFHGVTFGGISALAAGHGIVRRGGLGPLQSAAFRQITGSRCHACPWQLEYPGCRIQCAEELERVLAREDPTTVAAFVGNGHSLGVPVEYWPRIKEICARHNILFMMDEVLSGFGRMGTPWGMDTYGISPDILAFGKGVISGYGALAGVMVKDFMYDALRKTGCFYNQHTTSVHPPSCAAAVAVQKYIRRNKLFERVAPMGVRLAEHLAEIVGCLGSGAHVEGRGLLYHVSVPAPKLVPPKGPALTPFSDAVIRTCMAVARANGIVVWPLFYDGVAVVIGIAPAYTMDDAICDELARRFAEVVARIQSLTNDDLKPAVIA